MIMSNTHCKECHSQLDEGGEHYYNTQCVRARIKDLEAQLSNQWVSVEKESPEDCKPVIIHGGCGHYSHSNGKWYTNMERLNNGDYRQISWIVTEWQHLPEPSQ